MESPIMTTLFHEDLEVGERAIADLAEVRGKTMPVEALQSNAFLRTNKANQYLHACRGRDVEWSCRAVIMPSGAVP